MTEVGYLFAPENNGLAKQRAANQAESQAERGQPNQEFQQADSSTTKQQGGTGLGLAIAKRMVEMHGGEISIESSPGTGSTFTVRVPVNVQRQARTS